MSGATSPLQRVADPASQQFTQAEEATLHRVSSLGSVTAHSADLQPAAKLALQQPEERAGIAPLPQVNSLGSVTGDGILLQHEAASLTKSETSGGDAATCGNGADNGSLSKAAQGPAQELAAEHTCASHATIAKVSLGNATAGGLPKADPPARVGEFSQTAGMTTTCKQSHTDGHVASNPAC